VNISQPKLRSEKFNNNNKNNNNNNNDIRDKDTQEVPVHTMKIYV